MNPAAVGGSPYSVPPEPSPVSSTLLAVGVHAALLAFLWIGIRWNNVEPVAVTAEVWDMKVQDAAPNVPAPTPVRTPPPLPVPKVAPPPPPKVEEPVAQKTPDIALEREKKEKEKKLREQKLLADKKLADEKLAKEKEREEEAKELADKKAKEKADKLAKAAKAAAEEKLNQKMRDLEMKRILGGVAGAGDATVSTAPKVDNGYVTAVRNKIKRSTSFNGDTDVAGNPSATFKIEQLPTGEIISVRKTKGSGIGAFDDAVERGINNSSPLPKKKDGTVERTIEVTIRMKEVD